MKTQNNKALLLSLLMVLVTIVISCREDDSAWFPVTGKGEILKQERVISSFTKVKSRIGGNVFIRKANSQQIFLSAQENLLPLLETEVVNGTLFISFGSHVIKSDSTISVYISSPEITGMTLTGSGSMTTDFGIPSVSLEGFGTIKCSGTTDQVSAKISGSGMVDLAEMAVKRADIDIPGNGNVSLHVTESLNVTIPGMGTVYYQGKPVIEENIRGVGQVIERN